MNHLTLEDRIMHCWAVVEDLNLLNKAAERGANIQEIVKALICLYQIKFEELFLAYEQTLTNVSGRQDIKLTDEQLSLF